MQADLPNDVVAFQTANAVGIIRLNRPAVHNALNEPAITALESVLDKVESDPRLRALTVRPVAR